MSGRGLFILFSFRERLEMNQEHGPKWAKEMIVKLDKIIEEIEGLRETIQPRSNQSDAIPSRKFGWDQFCRGSHISDDSSLK